MTSRIRPKTLFALLVAAGSMLAQKPVQRPGPGQSVARPAPAGVAAVPAATAAGPRYEVVIRESTVGSEPTKQLQVSCPAGRKAVGAGWAVLDPTGAILDGNATYFEPAYDASGWLVNAQKVSTFSATWKLRVRVICGSADGAAGYEVAVRESTVGSEPVKQLALSCPAGKKAMGSGWSVLDATGAILEGRATYQEAAYDASGWLVNAQKVSTFSPTWKLRVRTVCGAAAYAGGNEVVVRESALGSEPTKQLQATCPAGKKALGAGWSVLDATGAILEGRATYFEPAYDASGWMVNAQKVSTFSPTWKLRVRMMCGTAA
jgi:hypothetical protein